MVAQKEGEMNKERDEKELRLVFNFLISEWPTNQGCPLQSPNLKTKLRIREKMRRAELNAREQRMERYSRIKENMAAEERKMEKQKQRLDQKLKQKEIKEKELENNLNKKLSQAEKQRKIKKVREGK